MNDAFGVGRVRQIGRINGARLCKGLFTTVISHHRGKLNAKCQRTSTLLMQTRIAPRWVAILGYMLALVVLLSAGTKPWLALAFPLWVMLVSKWMLHVRGQETGADAATASHN